MEQDINTRWKPRPLRPAIEPLTSRNAGLGRMTRTNPLPRHAKKKALRPERFVGLSTLQRPCRSPLDTILSRLWLFSLASRSEPGLYMFFTISHHSFQY